MVDIGKKIISYTMNKLFFPKKIVIDKPGIIINELSRRYGGVKSRRRTVFFFEDPGANLQVKTTKELGKDNAAELWYKIGKNVGTRYMLLANPKKMPSFLLPQTIDYIFNALKSAGFSIFEKINYNYKKKSLVLEGKDNIICRKSKEGEVFAGITSGVLSFLLRENIEAKMYCKNCPNYCKIVANKEITFRYKPDFKKLMPLENYDELNFPKKVESITKMYSFSDLFRFKKVWLDKSGKFCFKNKTISPATIGFQGLIADNYLAINKKEILEKGIVNGTKSLATDLLKDEKSTMDKIEALKIILCAFGWGIPHFKKENDRIIFSFVHIPVSKYSYLYYVFSIKGFLDHIFKKNFKIMKIERKINPVLLKIVYS